MASPLYAVRICRRRSSLVRRLASRNFCLQTPPGTASRPARPPWRGTAEGPVRPPWDQVGDVLEHPPCPVRSATDPATPPSVRHGAARERPSCKALFVGIAVAFRADMTPRTAALAVAVLASLFAAGT